MPQASRLEEELINNFPQAKVNLIKDSGGTFLVKVDEEVLFNKLSLSKTEKIFPKENEISEKINSYYDVSNTY